VELKQTKGSRIFFLLHKTETAKQEMKQDQEAGKPEKERNIRR